MATNAGADSKRIEFTDKAVLKIATPKSGQVQRWDSNTPGLSVVVSAGGTRAYRSQFKLHGRWLVRGLGRHGTIVINERDREELVDVAWARRQALTDQGEARANIDPRERNKRKLASVISFEAVVDDYIEKEAKLRQRKWKQTERILRRDFASLLKLPIATISDTQIQDLLDGYSANGNTRKAKLALTWARTMLRFAYRRKFVDAVVADRCRVEHVAEVRDHVFSDVDIRAVWAASEKLTDVERDYVRLVMLLAPRKTALAKMERSHLIADATVWVTPNALTKSKGTNRTRVYRTPLPPLARSILLERLRATNGDYVFPGPRSGEAFHPGTTIVSRLVREGAPKDFGFHAWRHTLASWLENRSYGLWERALVLNHAEGGVTAGYSHGDPSALKLKLLSEWGAHVQQVVGHKEPRWTIGMGELGPAAGALAASMPNEPGDVCITPEAAAAGIRLAG